MMNILLRLNTEFLRVICIVCLSTSIITLLISLKGKQIYLEDHHKECLGHYLKKYNYSQSIKNVGPYKGSKTLCYEYIQEHLSEQVNIKIEALKNIFLMDNFIVECMKDRYAVSDIKLDAAYLEMLKYLEGEEGETDADIENHKALVDAASRVEKLKISVFYYDCVLERFLHDDFKLICDAIKALESNNEPVVHKCHAEHLNTFYGYSHLTEQYNHLPEVPASICDTYVIAPLRSVIKDAFYNQQSIKFFKNYPKFRKCFMQKVEDIKLLNKVVVISIIAKFGMNEDTKRREFEHYSRLVKEFKNELYGDCVRRIEYS